MKKLVSGHIYDTDTAALVAHIGAIDEIRPRLWIYLTPRKHLFYVYEKRIGQYLFKSANDVRLEQTLVRYNLSEARKREILDRLYNLTMRDT